MQTMQKGKTENLQNKPEIFEESGFGNLADGILKFDASGNCILEVNALADGILKFDASGNCILEVSTLGNS